MPAKKVVNKPVTPAGDPYNGQGKEAHMREIERRSQAPSLTKLQRTFTEVCSNLSSFTSGKQAVIGNTVTVKLRDDGSWLAVLTYDDITTFDRMVCFGSGETFEGAIVNLSKSLAAGRVKPNKPWVPAK